MRAARRWTTNNDADNQSKGVSDTEESGEILPRPRFILGPQFQAAPATNSGAEKTFVFNFGSSLRIEEKKSGPPTIIPKFTTQSTNLESGAKAMPIGTTTFASKDPQVRLKSEEQTTNEPQRPPLAFNAGVLGTKVTSEALIDELKKTVKS